MKPTALFRLYQVGSALALPFAARHVTRKLIRAGQPALRAHERLGHGTVARGLGPLMWFHGASVGEVKSVLPLLHHLTENDGPQQILLTSGTATSAQAIEGRLPAGAVHQFAPLDGTGPLTRFFKHWRPDLCILVESELWPNLLDQCAQRGVPVALLNARLSDRSAQGWRRYPDTTRYVLRGIRSAHCQDRRTRDNLRAMGLRNAEVGVNLKSLVSPGKIDPGQRSTLRDTLGNRPVWLAASTHPGEEEVILRAHTHLLARHPDLCLIIAPRHPERGDGIAKTIRDTGLRLARRSAGHNLVSDTQVYLADTLGEMDLWYDLSPIVFVGGSFSDVGGHTPYEPAAAGAAILHGPRFANFTEAYAAFRDAEAAVEVNDEDGLTRALDELLTHADRVATLAENARPLAQDGATVLPAIAAGLTALARKHADG
ncbi:MAG: 3-deoxy-D-manno-octulosonic acid transferase [Pseudomonadota bacterium]